MKTFLAVLTLALVLPAPSRADFLVQPNDVVGIAGDSITQQHQYSAFMEDYLLMCQPTVGQKIVNFGWSGEQAVNFLSRLNTDVFPFHPTLVTTCYGMNDGHYGPLTDDTANTYRKAQTDIIEALKKGGVRTIVLGSAKCVDTYYFHRGNPDPNQGPDVYNKTLGALADIDKQIAQQEGLPYADVYGLTLDAMKRGKAKFGENYTFGGGDGVHPDGDGHLVMAYAFLKALGCDGNIGTITVDLGASQATATPGHEIVSCQNGVVTVKSTRYPFCFHIGNPATPPDPNSTSAVLTFFPEFNNDLNRFMLVVKGITGSKAKVTWGSGSKEYTADQLAKGVNLAADIMESPFQDQFNRVHTAVVAQETQETMLYQNYLHNLPDLKTNFAPGVDSAWDQIIGAAMKQHDVMFQNTAALVIPVTHTIKIESEP